MAAHNASLEGAKVMAIEKGVALVVSNGLKVSGPFAIDLYVDAQGSRFMNEGLIVDYPMSFGSESIMRNSPYYSIINQAYVDVIKTKGLYLYTKEKGAPDDWIIGNYYKEKILTNLDEDFEEGIAQGWAYKADTIQELGEFFGIENL